MSANPVDEQVEAERLRQLRAQIEELLREFDACAFVVLAGREGRFEQFQHVAASWSNLRSEDLPNGSRYLGLRSKKADYVGRAEEQAQHLAWSVGVVRGIGEIVGRSALAWLAAAERFDKVTNATHTPWKRDDPRDAP